MVYERQIPVLLIGCTLVDEEATCNRFSATACCFGTEGKILGQKPYLPGLPNKFQILQVAYEPSEGLLY